MSKAVEYSDEAIRKAIELKYKYHLDIANQHFAMSKKYKTALELFSEETVIVDPTTIREAVHQAVSKQFDVFGDRVNTIPAIKKTFEDIVIDILSDGKPRTTRMLFDAYTLKGLKENNAKDFSSKLSTRARAGKIRNIGFSKYPADKRYWWALAEWFEGETLKEEFYIKIQKLMGY